MWKAPDLSQVQHPNPSDQLSSQDFVGGSWTLSATSHLGADGRTGRDFFGPQLLKIGMKLQGEGRIDDHPILSMMWSKLPLVVAEPLEYRSMYLGRTIMYHQLFGVILNRSWFRFSQPMTP